MKKARAKPERSPGRPKDAAKRADIVRAATGLFMKNGFALTSMEAVAKKADVSKLTIYSHFANKDDLFRAVIAERCDRQAMPDCFLALAAGQPVAETLLQLGHRFVKLIFSDDSIRLQRIIQAEAVRHPRIVKIFYEAGPQRVRAAFGDLLKEWNQQKQLKVDDVALATQQFFSLLKGEMYLRGLMLLGPKPGPEELGRHVEATVALFLAGYQVKPKAGAQ